MPRDNIRTEVDAITDLLRDAENLIEYFFRLNTNEKPSGERIESYHELLGAINLRTTNFHGILNQFNEKYLDQQEDVRKLGFVDKERSNRGAEE